MEVCCALVIAPNSGSRNRDTTPDSLRRLIPMSVYKSPYCGLATRNRLPAEGGIGNASVVSGESSVK